MSALKLKLKVALGGTYRGTHDLASPEQKFDLDHIISLATGVAADQADMVFADTRTIAASGSENLDLYGGLTDAMGATLNFAEIVALLVLPRAANTNNVVVGGAASNGFITPFGAADDSVKVPPGGILLLAAPGANAFAVTSATGDLLKIANGGAGTSVTYDIYIIGRSA